MAHEAQDLRGKLEEPIDLLERVMAGVIARQARPEPCQDHQHQPDPLRLAAKSAAPTAKTTAGRSGLAP
jgi:hypothetical protein